MWLANTTASSSGSFPVAADSLFAQPAGNISLVPAVNFLTQDVKVKPYGSITLNTALNYRRDNGIELEGGLNFYARQAEKVRLKNDFTNPQTYGIPSMAADLNSSDYNDTASFATIDNTQWYNGDEAITTSLPITVPLVEADIDFNSAAQLAVLESTIYGVVGKNWDGWRFPGFAGVGGSYTYSVDNSGTDRWAVFGKLGVSF